MVFIISWMHSHTIENLLETTVLETASTTFATCRIDEKVKSELPYGGDLNAAIQKQDRYAIKSIMKY